jgi:ubiquinone/menaquinone biosynthesis C-methylase UbiE
VSALGDRIAAAFYDFMGSRVERELGPKRARVLAHARGRVLEIGGGTGFNLAHYPLAVDEVVFTEPSPAMRERAGRRARELGRPVQVTEASAERLPFGDGEFDTVVSTLVLCTVGDQERALAEIRRVLKPGGSLLFLEHVRSDDPRRARWQDRLERPWGVMAMGCHPNRPTLERIEAAGFAVEELERGELPKSAPIVRPMISGVAISRRSP